MKGHRGGCTTAFHVDDGHTFRKQTFGDQGGEADLASDVALAEAAHAAVSKPGLLDLVRDVQTRVGHHIHERLAREVLEGLAGLLTEGGA